MHPPDDERLDAPPGVEGEVIAGLVTDFSGFPLVGVRVEAAQSGGADLDLLPVMTDGQGAFELTGLADGTYDLRFVLGRVQARVLGVAAGKQDLQVRLARPQGLLLVVKTLDGDPPPGLIHVVLERAVKEGTVREYVGRHLESRLLLWSIRPGTYHVTVWGGRYVPVTAHGVRVREGVPAPEVELLLAGVGGTLRGRVLDALARATPGALVAWRRTDGPSPWPRHLCAATTDGDGGFVAPGLVTGRYRVSVGAPQGPFLDTEVDIVEGRDVELELRLSS